MTRFRALPVAVAAVLLSAGVAAAFSMPSAASDGLAKAAEHAGKTVPVRPAAAGLSLLPRVDTSAGADATADAAPTDLPDAAAHGAAVSAVAQADDTTPNTNHGADVSAVARDNHGQETAGGHKSADAGKPAGAGKPDGAGKPADPGAPDGAGRP